MERMAEKQAREIKIVLDKDRVEKGGELKQQARMARQATAELGKVKREQVQLKERLEYMATEQKDMSRTLVRERRMAKKQAREIKIVLDKDRVEKGGELKQQARMARQATAELGKVKREQVQLKERLEYMATEQKDVSRTLVRERRPHDVDSQTM
jgi:hypothetical protein